jgi:tRNA(fMet)-specific endonuclease VapC
VRYLLDANAVIVLLNGTNPKLARRLRRESLADVGVSAIVLHELYYGAFRSSRPAANLAVVDQLQFSIVTFEKEDARSAGQVRAQLRVKGTPVGPYDVLIAGQALGRRLVLVTHNRREFARVAGLVTEDWEA